MDFDHPSKIARDQNSILFEPNYFSNPQGFSYNQSNKNLESNHDGKSISIKEISGSSIIKPDGIVDFMKYSMGTAKLDKQLTEIAEEWNRKNVTNNQFDFHFEGTMVGNEISSIEITNEISNGILIFQKLKNQIHYARIEYTLLIEIPLISQSVFDFLPSLSSMKVALVWSKDPSIVDPDNPNNDLEQIFSGYNNNGVNLVSNSTSFLNPSYMGQVTVIRNTYYSNISYPNGTLVNPPDEETSINLPKPTTELFEKKILFTNKVNAMNGSNQSYYGNKKVYTTFVVDNQGSKTVSEGQLAFIIITNGSHTINYNITGRLYYY